jgi:hypothetical protein
MRILIDDDREFAENVILPLAATIPDEASLICYWAASYGVHSFAAFIQRSQKDIEMMSHPRAASDYVYADWARRHQIASDLTYEGWLMKRKELLPLSWNWGWAKRTPQRLVELHFFDDVIDPDGGIPGPQHEQEWRRQMFGDAKIVYPQTAW